MIVRFRQIENLGRFGGWDTALACKDEARLRRVALVYGRNGAGKSTLVRLLSAASAGASLDGDRLLGAIGSPRVTLELAAGRLQYAEDAWTGPRPQVLAFDREFVEKNVFVGRRTSKDQRRQLLELALGSRDVSAAQALDKLNTRGRELAKARRAHEAVLGAEARASGLSLAAYLALPPLADPVGARAAAEAGHRAAVAADTLGKLAHPEPLPALPILDFAALAALLGAESQAIGRDVAATVEAHLASRLRGTGSAWVRAGLDHADGTSCPFCAQPVAQVALIEMYRLHFDRAYDQLVARIDAARARVAELDAWWREVQRTGAGNVRAFDSWAQFADVSRPPFDSVTRRRQLDELGRALASVLDAKRLDARRAVSADGLAGLRATDTELRAAVAAYNEAIGATTARIAARLREVGGGSVRAAQQQLSGIDAAVRRHAPEIAEHVGALARLDGELAALRTARDGEIARLQTASLEKLATFAARITRVLGELGADFTVTAVDTERTGGAAAARLTLQCERGELEVGTARDEERLQRALGDGDRSTLALAVFLLALEELGELSGHVLVFDDPSAAQDEERARRTAAQIVRLAAGAGQVMVLSHQPAFLYQVAEDWRRAEPGRAGDLGELELDRERRALVPWSASVHLEHEQARAVRDLRRYVRDLASPISAADVEPTLRPILEAHVRALSPATFDANRSLEAAFRALRKALTAREWIRFSLAEIEELERLATAPTAPAAPEEIRTRARRVLAFVEGRFGATDLATPQGIAIAQGSDAVSASR